jgi:hypothetical protein
MIGLLGKDPEKKISFFVWVKCAWDDDIGAWWQAKPTAHLPEIDKDLGTGDGPVILDKFRVKRTGN